MKHGPSESTSVTIEISPPKYQVPIGKQARKALGVEGERSVLQADLSVKRIVSEGGEK